MRKTRLVIMAALFLLLSHDHSAFSQQQPSQPTGLALEVTYYGGRPPAYQPVPAADPKGVGSWYGLFGRIASWKPPADSLTVQAVNIVPHVEGDSVRVAVSVFVGAQRQEKELPVAAYLMRENETIKTSALAEFGVEPFQIKVTRVSPVPSALPQVVNRTESVAVLNIEANN